MIAATRRFQRLALILAGSGLALVVLAADGSAQTPVGTPEGPIGQPVHGPVAPRELPEKPPPRHSFWIRAQEGWERNPLLREGGDEETSFVDSISAGAAYTFRGRRGELSFDGDGGRLNYHDLPELSRWAYGGGLRGVHNFSQRSSFQIRERYNVSTYNPSSILETSGLPVSLVRSKTNVANADLRLGFSARTTFDFGVRHEKIVFDDDPTSPSTAALVDSNAITFEPRLSRSIGRADSLSLGYSYQKSLETTTGADSQSVYAGWSGRLGRRVGAALSAGVTRLSEGAFPLDPAAPDAPTPLASQWQPYGLADFSYDFRQGSIEASYSHSVSLAFGFGQQRVSDIVGMNLNRTFGRKTTARANTSYSRSRDLGNDATLNFKTFSAGGYLRHQLSRRFDLAAGYNYGKTTSPAAGGVGDYRTERAFVALSYGRLRE